MILSPHAAMATAPPTFRVPPARRGRPDPKANWTDYGRAIFAALILACLLAACSTTKDPVERSRAEFATGDRTQAFARLRQAVREQPNDPELRAYYVRQRELLTAERLADAERARAAGRLDEAARRYREAQEIDPDHPRARAGLEAVEADRRRVAWLAEAQAAWARNDLPTAERLVRGLLAGAPNNARARKMLRDIEERAERQAPLAQALTGPLAKPVSLQFRDAPLRVVFESLSHAAGLNFVFDRDVKVEAPVTLFVRDSSVDEVIKLIAITQQIERKVLNANSVLIYPATPAKQRDYQELVTRSFYLANADAKQAQSLLKQLVKSKDMFIDEKLNLLVIKDTPQAVRLAERLLASLDVAEPEVMLEVEVLEVARSKLRELGLDFPDEIGYGLLRSQQQIIQTQTAAGIVSEVVTLPGSEIAPGVVPRAQWGDLTGYVTNPALTLRLRAEDGDTNLLANPRIRVKNREKAKIHIGEKLPVFTTTSTANVGVSASVSYLDVGLKLDVEPAVTLDDEVAIKVALEVSNIVREVPGPSDSLAYQVGTRSAATVLRLRNGETQVLAGLINDEERRSAQRLPGLGELPLIGRLFSSERNNASKTEIVLLITPRIVRNIVAPSLARADLPAGTDASVGAAGLTLNPTPPGSLGLWGGDAGAPGAAPDAVHAEIPLRDDAPPLAQPATGSEGPGVLSIAGPSTARSGERINVTLDLVVPGSIAGGEAILGFDPLHLEPAGGQSAGDGRISVDIPAGAERVTVQVPFVVRPGTSGSVDISLEEATLRRSSGETTTPEGSGGVVSIEVTL